MQVCLSIEIGQCFHTVHSPIKSVAFPVASCGFCDYGPIQLMSEPTISIVKEYDQIYLKAAHLHGSMCAQVVILTIHFSLKALKFGSGLGFTHKKSALLM